MADEKLLRQILSQRYGITTAGELREAIERMEKLNICWATRCGRDDILVTSHNRSLDEVLALLRVYMPETNIGFSVQNEIIKTCAHNGVSIKTERR